MLQPMSRIHIKLLFYTLLISGWIGYHPIKAQGMEDALFPFINEFGPGGRAMAMGGAFMPVAEDYSAVYWNPAGLAQIRKMEFYAALGRNMNNRQITYQGTTTHNNHGFTTLNAGGFVFPIPTYRGSLVFALGFHRVNSLSDYYRFSGSPLITSLNKRFDQSEEITVEGGINHWSFGGAVDITPNVSLGATVNLITGRNDLSVSYKERDPLDILDGTKNFDASFEVSPKYTGAGFKFGSLFRPIPDLRVALTIASPSYLSIEENSNSYEIWERDTGATLTYSENSYRKYRIQSPWRFEIGASYKYRIFLISGSVEMLNWSETQFSSNILGDEGKDIDAEINGQIRSLCRETANYRLGTEVIVPQLGAKLMMGYRYQASPFKPSAEIVKSNRQFLSGGVSFLLDKQVKIDFAYEHGWWNQSTTDNFLGKDENYIPFYTREKLNTNRFLISFSYRF